MHIVEYEMQGKMKIKENYKVRKIAGENLIVKQGEDHSDLTKIISLNPTAMYLWEELQGKEFTSEEAGALLEKKFGIDANTAFADARSFLRKLVNEGIIDIG